MKKTNNTELCSGSSSVATVGNNGVVSAISVGTVTITLTFKYITKELNELLQDLMNCNNSSEYSELKGLDLTGWSIYFDEFYGGKKFNSSFEARPLYGHELGTPTYIITKDGYYNDWTSEGYNINSLIKMMTISQVKYFGLEGVLK